MDREGFSRTNRHDTVRILRMQSRIEHAGGWRWFDIAALTAVVVAQVFNARSEDARPRRELAAGSAVAALEITAASDRGDIQLTVDQLGESRQLALLLRPPRFASPVSGARITVSRSQSHTPGHGPGEDGLTPRRGAGHRCTFFVRAQRH
jgi:hypothetical protein